MQATRQITGQVLILIKCITESLPELDLEFATLYPHPKDLKLGAIRTGLAHVLHQGLILQPYPFPECFLRPWVIQAFLDEVP